ncbi:MAG: N-6 DNA methylase, partial [Thermoleophilia bacterium]|nr:N-6 DNA methylase [Thermoleophilia bacterium]
MSRSARTPFQTIRSEGGLLPADLLQRVASRDRDLPGLRDEDYHASDLPLNERIVRSWNRLVGAWTSFQDARAQLPADDPGTTLTRERLLLPLFEELGYGRLQTARAVEIEGRSYPVSHAWQHVPIHLVGCNVPLDRRTSGVAGAASHSPHGLLQELLNRSEERLWGFVSNGLLLRVLRDNSSLTRQAYLELDLEQMLASEAYADFVLLWLVCHESRLEAKRPHSCWLERWSQEAARQGTRALDSMRDGVERAISTLGAGFLSHPANATLREALRTGELPAQDYYRELLRLVYRLLFLFVAEDRGLLLSPDASAEARERYERWYSTARLRQLASRRRGTRHGDLYAALRLVMAKLGDDEGCPELGLPALGSFLWSHEATPHLAQAELSNEHLLEAIRSLATLREGKVLRTVDYRNLGAEELGSVYESLLELRPELNADAGTFELRLAAGNERKTTGSYYTPANLISCLLDSALDPVLEEAARKGEEAILDLKVVDPACGSGHFLVAAAHRIAKRLASLRTGDAEPSPEATRQALRDVVSRCLYGVDVNPMAVELCKVALWIEALDPGRPLSFLDAHIRCGNSLLGTTS